MKRTRYNPERRAWRGRSHRAAGRRIAAIAATYDEGTNPSNGWRAPDDGAADHIEVRGERDNGDREAYVLCTACRGDVDDFLEVTSERPVAGRCDRCER